ncbi:MAG: nucleotidyltransferase domain-containing protein [Bacillota bacterium]
MDKARRIPPAEAVTPKELAAYRAAARRRWEQGQQERARRRKRAWEVARQAAQLLKEQFGATRVAVFGSLGRTDSFTRWSDVDLAVWGLRPEDTFRAMGAVMDLDKKIKVNLVDIEVCRPSVRTAIEREGIEL